MRRDEMNSGRQMWRHVAHDRGLDRPDVRKSAAGREVRTDLGGDRSACSDRYADNDEIGANDRGRVIFNHLVGEPELRYAPTCRSRVGGGHDLAHHALLARGARDRGADKAHADQRQPVIKHGGFGHGITRVWLENL
jgi:hypothetical protein